MIIFNHWDTDIVLVYEEGYPTDFLEFYEFVDGEITEPFATLSVNVPYSRELNHLEFPIKNYSENEGLLDLLKQHNLGHVTGSVASGFVIIPIFQFDEAKLKEALYNPEALDVKAEMGR